LGAFVLPNARIANDKPLQDFEVPLEAVERYAICADGMQSECELTRIAEHLALNSHRFSLRLKESRCARRSSAPLSSRITRRDKRHWPTLPHLRRRIFNESEELLFFSSIVVQLLRTCGIFLLCIYHTIGPSPSLPSLVSGGGLVCS
jgi:hypothetical protein